MNKLIIANLLHRPMRSIISIVAVAIEVIMILSIVGIFMGMLNDQKARTNGIGADLMMRGSNANNMNGMGATSIPVAFADVIRKLPHVTVVSPAALQTAMTQNAVEIISGIDYDSYNALRPFVFLAGGPFKRSDDVMIDDVFARSKNPQTGKPWAVGDTLEVINTPFHICGIVEHGKGGRKLIPLSTMGQLIGAPNKASIFYIKADDTKNDEAIIEEIHNTRGLLNFPVQTMEEWLSTMTPEKMPGFNLALEVVQGIAIIVGFLVIFQTMYTAVLERTREIGILKSMGASKSSVVGVILRETAFLAVIGVIVGIAGTYLVRVIMLNATSLQFEITSRWLAQGAAIAFVGSILGAVYPGWMAARKDPIDALAYE